MGGFLCETSETLLIYRILFIELKKLMKYIKDKEDDDEDIDRVYRNLDIDAMKETDMNDEGTSYSVNKGQELSICMRDKDHPEYKLHDINTLMY